MREGIKIKPIRAEHHPKLTSAMTEEVTEYKFKKPSKLDYED